MEESNDWLGGVPEDLFGDTFNANSSIVFPYTKNSRKLVKYMSETSYITSRTLLNFHDMQLRIENDYREASAMLDNSSSAGHTISLPTELSALKNSIKNENKAANAGVNTLQKDENKLITPGGNTSQNDENKAANDGRNTLQKDENVPPQVLDENIHVSTTTTSTPSMLQADRKNAKKSTPTSKINTNFSSGSKSSVSLKEEGLSFSGKNENLSANLHKTTHLQPLGKNNTESSSLADQNSSSTSVNKPVLPGNTAIRKPSLSGLDSNAGGQYFKAKQNRTSQYFKPLPVRSINGTQNKNRTHLYSMKEEEGVKTPLLDIIDTQTALFKKSFADANKAHDRIKIVRDSTRTGVNMPSLTSNSNSQKTSVSLHLSKKQIFEQKISLATAQTNKHTTNISSSQNVFDRLTSTATKSSINKNNAARSAANRVSPIRQGRSPLNLKQKRIDVTPPKAIDLRVRRTPVQNSNGVGYSNPNITPNKRSDLSFSTPKATISASSRKLSERKNQLLNISPLRKELSSNSHVKIEPYNKVNKSPKKPAAGNNTHNTLKRNLQMSSAHNNQPPESKSVASKDTNLNTIKQEHMDEQDSPQFKSPSKLNSVLHDIDFKDHRLRIGDRSFRGQDQTLPEINSESETDETAKPKHKQYLQPWATESSLLSLIRQQQRDRTRDPFKIFGPIRDVEMLDQVLK